MKKFSDLGVQIEQDFFVCKKVSIDDLLNKKIIVLGVKKGIATRMGENRYLLHVRLEDGTEAKAFTTARFIKAAIDQIQEDEFPFETVIMSVKCDSKKMYKFT